MAPVDAGRASSAHEDVLVVVRHADDLVRHHLPDGQDEIVLPGPDQIGQLHGPRKIHRAFGNLPDKLPRHLADGRDAGAPVVHPEQLRRDAGKHFRNLVRGHRGMRAERGQHVGQARAKVVVRQPGQAAGLRVEAGEVRGNHQHAPARAEASERLVEAGAQVVRREPVGDGTAGVVQHGVIAGSEPSRPWRRPSLDPRWPWWCRPGMWLAVRHAPSPGSPPPAPRPP